MFHWIARVLFYSTSLKEAELYSKCKIVLAQGVMDEDFQLTLTRKGVLKMSYTEFQALNCRLKNDKLPGVASEAIKSALKWGQEEWIAAVLGFEDTEQEAVGSKKNTRPDQNSQLLTLDIFHTRNLQCECNCSKRQDGI